MYFMGKNKAGDEYTGTECMEHHDEIIDIFIDLDDEPTDLLASEIRTLDLPCDLDDGEFGKVLCDAFPKLEAVSINAPHRKITGRKEIKKLTNAGVDDLLP
ncbi:MAG: hypothetical protein F9K21_05975 [Rhodocyclaceae bacterium]|nr:MAG: hypothetical protein F9K21_05975 [Rhodocyclaceae bacterium]CAG0929138.1 hypothetical protein RHDC3_01000 [Rhodocyclaceae bacterium]